MENLGSALHSDCVLSGRLRASRLHRGRLEEEALPDPQRGAGGLLALAAPDGRRGAGRYALLDQRLPDGVRGRPQQPRHAGAVQVRGVVGRAGRLAAAVELAAGLLLEHRGIHQPPQAPRHDALRHGHADGDAGVLPDHERLRRQPVQGPGGGPRDHQRSGRQRPEPAAPVLGHGHSSAHALPGLRGLRRALRLRHGRAHHAPAQRRLDPYHAALDAHHLAVPELRHPAGRRLGLRRARLGRLLGLGSRGERLAAALDHRHRLPALGHDAGEEGNDEGVEHGAHLRHLLAVHLRHVPDAVRDRQLGACLRAIADRQVVRRLPGDHCGGHST